MGLDDEAERLSQCLGNKNMMMMGNHGFLSVGETPALAFDLAYHYERGCRTYITALSTGAPLSFLPDSVAEKPRANGNNMIRPLTSICGDSNNS